MTSLRRALALVLLPLVVWSCRSAASGEARKSYVIAFLVRGPAAAGKTAEERQTIQAAHMANIERLAGENKLVIAGPFGKPVPDEALRGIFVFDTREIETARAWTSTDPAVKAGVLGMELATIRTGTALRRALELYRATLANGPPGSEHGDKMRGYVMLIARDGARGERGLAAMRERGKVVFEGELVGSARGTFLAVLDAERVDEARSLLGGAAAQFGDHDLASWWAMGSLARLASRSGGPVAAAPRWSERSRLSD